MEHGTFTNDSKSTFTVPGEGDTLANSVRFMLYQDPRVTLASYSIPHPSNDSVNIRVETTGDAAREVLKDACQELMLINRHVRSVFGKVFTVHKVEQDRIIAEKAEEAARKKAQEEEELLKKQMEQIQGMDIETN
ncbi:unnamed protein product [Cochlearia groenlandica]